MRPETKQFWLQPVWEEGRGVGESFLWTKHDQGLIDHLGEDVFCRLILDAPIVEQAGVRVHSFSFLSVSLRRVCACVREI